MRAAIVLSFTLTFPTPLVAQAAPERTLQDAESLPDPYSLIRGVRELSDGRILVVDQREIAVYLTDFRTGARVKVGREGAGPREHKTPVGLVPLRGDSSLLIDIQNGRIAILDGTGEIVTTFPNRLFEHFITNVRADTIGHVYFEARGTAADPDQRVVYRWQRPADVLDTIATLVSADRFLLDGRRWPVPWSVRDVWAVTADGRVAVVRREPYRVEWIENDGSAAPARTVDYNPLRVSRGDRERWNERPGVAIVGGAAGAPRGPARWEFPDHFPPFVFQGASASPDGRLWVERKQSDTETRPLLDVFDGEGRLLERIRLPAGRDVVGFGDGTIYATREDEVGLLWLERYRYE